MTISCSVFSGRWPVLSDPNVICHCPSARQWEHFCSPLPDMFTFSFLINFAQDHNGKETDLKESLVCADAEYTPSFPVRKSNNCSCYLSFNWCHILSPWGERTTWQEPRTFSIVQLATKISVSIKFFWCSFAGNISKWDLNLLFIFNSSENQEMFSWKHVLSSWNVQVHKKCIHQALTCDMFTQGNIGSSD